MGCNKDDDGESNIRYSYMSDSLKAQYAFNIGSYWVYQNASLETDSVFILNRETGFTETCPQNACTRNEFITLTLSNVTQGFSFNHYLLSNFIRYNGGGTWGQEGQPIFVENASEGDTFNGLLVGAKLDSLVIFDETFFHVEKMTVEADMQIQNEFEFNTDFYFVPHVGVVRKVVHDAVNGPITWDLKRYHVE